MLYRVNGLNLECDIPLGHARPASADRPPELVIIHAGSRPVPPILAEGELIQGVRAAGNLLYTTVRRNDGSVLLRLHGRAEFEISADHRAVRAWSDPACDPEMLGIFVGGTLLATVLALRGETVLHASAVEIGGVAVAFVADSGVGKSTLAALACARGARFVTDDLLRFRESADGVIRCWRGATENRLRRDVADLSGEFASTATRRSADNRTVWRPPATTFDACRLAAVVLPRPDRERAELELRPLTPGAAVVELSRRPRLLGMADRRIVAKTFLDLAGLARVVPVYAVRIPWGPPFDPVVIDTLVDRCVGGTGPAARPTVSLEAGSVS